MVHASGFGPPLRDWHYTKRTFDHWLFNSEYFRSYSYLAGKLQTWHIRRMHWRVEFRTAAEYVKDCLQLVELKGHTGKSSAFGHRAEPDGMMENSG